MKNRIFLLAVSLIFILRSTAQTNNYPFDSNAELVVVEGRVIALGIGDYSSTNVTAAFYSSISSPTNSPVGKIYNNNVFCEQDGLGFSIYDSTYKTVDTSFIHKTLFTWQFPDLTNANTLIQYKTTKPLQNLSGFTFTYTSVTRSSGFSYSHPLIQADSIVYVIGTDSVSKVKKTITGSSTGISYTSTELAQLGATSNGTFAMIIFNMMPQTYNGKKYYFQSNSFYLVSMLPVN